MTLSPAQNGKLLVSGKLWGQIYLLEHLPHMVTGFNYAFVSEHGKITRRIRIGDNKVMTPPGQPGLDT